MTSKIVHYGKLLPSYNVLMYLANAKIYCDLCVNV